MGSIRIAGTVHEVTTPVLRWEAEVDGQTFTGTRDGAVVILDGEPLTIHARGAALLGDAARTKLPWSEIATRFGLPVGNVPPFSEATLEVVELAPGTAVDVAGAVTDHAFKDDGGPRDAPTSRPRTVQADVVGIGKRAKELVDDEIEKRAREANKRGSRKLAVRTLATRLASMTATEIADIVVLVIAAVLLVIAARVAQGASNLHAVVGFACGVVAVTCAMRPRQTLVPFRAREKVHGRVMHLDVVWRCVVFVFAMFPLVMGLAISTGSVQAGTGDVVTVAAQVIAAFGLFTIAMFTVGEVFAHPTVSRLARLAANDAIEGVIETSHPQSFAKRAGVLGRTEQWFSTSERDSKGNTRTVNRMASASFAAAPTFTVKSDGSTVEVASSDVAWASTLRVRHRPDGGGWQIHMFVPNRERVVVAGARDGGKLRADGISPVLLLAGPDNPKQWARRAVRARYLVRAVLVASAAGLVWATGVFG